MSPHSQLPRLPRQAYMGRISIHWTHTINHRKTGWLNAAFHTTFREALLHSLSRYQLACPAYCLMPDHFHLLLSGLSEQSDQINFTKRLRTDLSKRLINAQFQKQAHDSILRSDQTDKNAFQSIAHYIFENPVRKGLSNSPSAYPYSGALFPGYFGLDPTESAYWDRYWKIFNRNVTQS